MKSCLLPIVAVSLLSTIAGAQTTLDPRRQTPERAVPAQTSDDGGFEVSQSALDGVGSDLIDGLPVVVGPGYRSFYDSERVLFHPALGEIAPTTQHLEFRLESIELGGEPLVGVTPTQPRLDGDAVVYDRGLVLERYEATKAGIEQTFTLNERQTFTGDLVVRGRINTSLPWDGVVGATGLSFVDSVYGGVTIGGVTGVDANGATTPGEVRFDGEFVEYVLPASFVANAVYPLVLDPLIGPDQIINGTFGNGRGFPDVAYNADANHFLSVWQVAYAANDFDVHAVNTFANGFPTSSVLLVRVTIGKFSGQPSVGYARGSLGFILAWTEDGIGPAENDIWVRAYLPLGSGLDDPMQIAVGPSHQSFPVVSGDSFTGTSGQDTVVVWNDSVTGIWAAHVRPLSGIIPGVTDVLLVMPGTGFSDLTITKSGGQPGNWVIAAARFFTQPTPGDYDLRFAVVDFDLTIQAGPQGLSLIGTNERHPAVDGDGSDFLLAYQTDETGFENIRYRTLDSAGVLGSSTDLPNTASLNYRTPEVSDTGNRYMVTFEYDTTYGTDLAYVELCSANLELCKPFTMLKSTPSERANLGIASKRSGNFGDTTDEGLIVWQDNDLNPQETILAQAFDGTLGGSFVNLGGSCGSGTGVFATSSPAIGNPNFGWNVFVPATANFVIMNARLNPSPPFICGSCVIQADLGIVLIEPTVAATATFDTPLPPNPLLIGLQVTTQFFALPTTLSPCSVIANVSVTDRVRITIGN